MVAGMLKGTGSDNGHAIIESAAVARKFWELYMARRGLRSDRMM